MSECLLGPHMVALSYGPWLFRNLSDLPQTSFSTYLPQASTSKGHILIQVLLLSNGYTKSANEYIHFAKSFCCLLMQVRILIAIRLVN